MRAHAWQGNWLEWACSLTTVLIERDSALRVPVPGSRFPIRERGCPNELSSWRNSSISLTLGAQLATTLTGDFSWFSLHASHLHRQFSSHLLGLNQAVSIPSTLDLRATFMWGPST